MSSKVRSGWSKLGMSASLLVIAPLLMAPKCGEQVVIPSSDNSKPVPQFYYRIDDGTATEFPDSNEIDIEEGQKVCVYIIGTDPQGLKNLSWRGETSWTCHDPNGDLGVHRYAALGDDEAQAGRPGNKAYTGMYLEHCLETENMCRGWVLQPGAGTYYDATAENYHGKKTDFPIAYVNINVKPAPKPPVTVPKPQPPKQCSSNQRCCEPGINGGCLRCVDKDLICQ